MEKNTTVLMILDGYGLSPETDNNAIAQAKTPHLDWLFEKFPFQPGGASGLDVGLPDGQMGNSEVGHTNIGAGRIVYQELTRISKAIEEGDFVTNETLLNAMHWAKTNDSALHFMGLVSDGGVHSHNTHLYALLELAKQNGLTKVYVHAFLDGRDTPPTSGAGFIEALEAKLNEIGVGKIATVSGRYYAMDRDNRWDRVALAYNALTKGEGATAGSAAACIANSYAESIEDEFILPTVIHKDGIIQAKDSVVFFNFRPDRAREITQAFVTPDFDAFPRGSVLPGYFATFTDYDSTITQKHVAFAPVPLDNVLGEYISAKGLTQYRIAETEKYAHVTFFFNGGVELPYPGEDRELIPSPDVATYDLEPNMSAQAITDKLVEAIQAQKHDLIIVNYANPDMVGHTGSMDATITAIETIDTCVARAMDVMLQTGTPMFLCADHGNADKMIDTESNAVFTAHSTNPVPFSLFNYPGYTLRSGGVLADIAPTLLAMLDLPVPPEMTGTSLLVPEN